MRASIGRALILTVLSTFACHTAKVVPVDQVRASDRVWVTLSDQSTVVVYGPQIYGTKLVGFVEGKYVEVPTTQVQMVQVRETAGARTGALVALGALAAGGLVFWLADKGSPGPGRPDICDEEPDNEICVQ